MISEKKTGIIFGATNKIGAALAAELSKKNCDFIIQDSNRKKLENLWNNLEKKNSRQTILQCDHTNLKNLEKIDVAILQKFTRLDFLIITVGYIDFFRPLTDLSLKDWNKLLDINLNFYWLILKKLEYFLKKSQKPNVFFFYNQSISNGKPYFHGYSVAKAALKALTEIYMEEKQKFNFDIKILDLEKNYFSEIEHLINQKKISNFEKKILEISDMVVS